MRKPADYRFSKLNPVWPAAGVLELEGPNRERILIDRIATDPKAYLERLKLNPNKAAVNVPVGSENWVLVVEAPAAETLLRTVRSWVSF